MERQDDLVEHLSISYYNVPLDHVWRRWEEHKTVVDFMRRLFIQLDKRMLKANADGKDAIKKSADGSRGHYSGSSSNATKKELSEREKSLTWHGLSIFNEVRLFNRTLDSTTRLAITSCTRQAYRDLWLNIPIVL